jgi:integrase
MKRRGNSEGSIFKRADGRWTATISMDRGRRKSYYGTTRPEVAAKLATALKTRLDGGPLPSEQLTVARFLVDWLAAVRPSLRASTYKRYTELLTLHAVPTLGSVRLARLAPADLQKLYAAKVAGGLSPRTVGHAHSVIHHALRDATRWGNVARNVAALVSRPRAERHEMATLSTTEARALLEAARGDRFAALYVLALATGARQGELLALRWADIDFDAATLSIRASLRRYGDHWDFNPPKTARSRRQVALTGGAVAALRAHRARQLEERLAQPYWQDATLVFASEAGTPVDATNLIRRSFNPLLVRAGLSRIRFHDLRHSAATFLLGQGVHPKIASEMLGHSSVAITLDTYSHVTAGMQRQAVDALEAVLGS